MRIVVDAMGTDNRPVPDVAGAVLAAEESTDTIILVGDEQRIKTELAQFSPQQRTNLEVVHADEEILMVDKPALVGKSKPGSSMHVGLKLVETGEADAFVSGGNTGAIYSIALLHSLGRIPGVKRPALCAIFPILQQWCIFLDVGANADAKPEWLLQFSTMGNIYARHVLGLNKPRVGLLSNGEEQGKGNELVRETDMRLRELNIPNLNYIGNVEPSNILAGGVEVIVSDGFTGNIMVKTFEATGRYLTRIIRDEIRASVFTSIGGGLARPAFERVRQRTDTAEVGGAPLLGVNGVVIVSHGSADAHTIKNAVQQARNAINGDLIAAVQVGIQQLTNETAES